MQSSKVATKFSLKRPKVVSCFQEKSSDTLNNFNIENNNKHLPDTVEHPNFVSHILQKYKHIINRCEVCQFTFETNQDLQAHKQSAHIVDIKASERADLTSIRYDSLRTNHVNEEKQRILLNYDLEQSLVERQALVFSLLETFLSENPEIKLNESPLKNDIENIDGIDCQINFIMPKLKNVEELEKDIYENEYIFDQVELIESSNASLSTNETTSKKWRKKSNCGQKSIYDCKKCSRIFMEKKEFNEHVSAHEEIKYLCKVCGKTFRKSSYLESHVLKHYTCKLCEKSVQTKNDLKIHILSHKGILQCIACDKTFKEKTTYLKHQSVHKKVNSLSCKFCDKSYKTEKGLDAHYKMGHSRLNYLKCDKCGKKFNNLGYLNWRKHTITLSCLNPRKSRTCK